MTKYFCDACGKEIKEGRIYKVPFLCHIVELPPVPNYKGVLHGYRDSEGNLVSGREVNTDLCIKCYNIVMGVAWESVQTLKKEHGI